MSVKITNTQPRNGDLNVPIAGGVVNATGTVDEDGTTVRATVTAAGGGTVATAPVSEFLNAGGQWHFSFPAAPQTWYSLEVDGSNSGGTGSSTITFRTA
jgi:hypothetical protein